MLVSMSSQMIWLNFAGIFVPQMETIFNVGLDRLGFMLALWPLIFIPLSIPVGLVVDKWGFRKTVGLGAFLIALFSWLRILAGTDFYVLLLFQTLAGIGQPFIFNGISKLAGNWFPKGEQTIANGIGAMGQIIGLLMALLITPVMVTGAFYHELWINMVVFSLFATVSFSLFAVHTREYPEGVTVPSVEHENLVNQMKQVLLFRNIIVLMILFLIGVGIFSGLISWIETILESSGISPFWGSIDGAVLLIGGIIGMVAISVISEAYSKLKQVLILNAGVSAVLLLLLSVPGSLLYYLLLSFGIGFFLVSMAPLGLQISLETVGEQRAGAAAGLLWLTSQVGAVILIEVMELLAYYQSSLNIFPTSPWFMALVFLGCLTLMAFALTFLIKDTRKSGGQIAN